MSEEMLKSQNEKIDLLSDDFSLLDEEKKVDFSELFDREKAFQKKTYGLQWPWDLDYWVQKYGMFLGLEVGEMIRCVNYKDHKKKQEIDMNELRYEIADVFIYTLAVAGAVFDSSDDFLATIKDKMDINEKRKDWDTKR